MLLCYFQARVEKENAAKLLKIKITHEILVARSKCILCQAGLLIRKSHLKPLESSRTDLGIVEKVDRKGLCVACRADGNSCLLVLILTLLLFMALGKSLNFLISGSVSLPVK